MAAREAVLNTYELAKATVAAILSQLQPPPGPGVVSTAARDAVLNTYELTEAIIASLPADSIETAKLTCKKWNAMIKTSPTIQKAIILTPSMPKSKTAQWMLCNAPRSEVRYESDAKIQMHPRCIGSVHLRQPGWVMDEFSNVQHMRNTFKGFEHEYLTKPRCSAIGMTALYLDYRDDKWKNFQCSVYAQQGLKVQDLLDMAPTLERQVSDIMRPLGQWTIQSSHYQLIIKLKWG
jgi:hypothetical protein